MPGTYLTTPEKEKKSCKQEKNEPLSSISSNAILRLFLALFQKQKQLDVYTEERRKDGQVEQQQKKEKDRILMRLSKKDPKMTSTEGARLIKDFANKDISRWIVSRRLTQAGLYSRRAVRKPLMTAGYRKQRLLFARAYQSWTKQDWANVIFVNETKVDIFSPKCNHLSRRPIGKQILFKYVRSTMRAGSIMCFGAMTKNVAGPLILIQSTMNARQYMEILEGCLLSFPQDHMAPGWFLYQDNSPVHKSKLMTGRTVNLLNGGKTHLLGWFTLNNVSLINVPSSRLI